MMKATADSLSLSALVEQAITGADGVAKVYRVYRIFPPLDTGEETEVLFVGRLRGAHHPGPLTAWLCDFEGGFSPDVRVTDGWG